jgi:hypothetical protein
MTALMALLVRIALAWMGFVITLRILAFIITYFPVILLGSAYISLRLSWLLLVPGLALLQSCEEGKSLSGSFVLLCLGLMAYGLVVSFFSGAFKGDGNTKEKSHKKAGLSDRG